MPVARPPEGGTTTDTRALTLGLTERFGVKALAPRGTSTQPPSLQTATRPPITPTRRPSSTAAVYSVPRMPMVPEGVSSR